MKNKLLMIALLLLGFVAVAGDEEAALEISADRFEADRGKNISMFTGNVVITKGTIRIEADEVRVHAPGGEIQDGTFIGNPVTFAQDPVDAAPIRGAGQRMEYDATREIVTLTGKAWLTQGSDRFSGETIRYDLVTGKVIATSKESATERVRAIFKPKKAK